MHNIGDNVVYGSCGVMRIVDVREETIGEVSRKYYVLKAPAENNSSLTFVPVDNEVLVAAMRPLLSKEEALAVIDSIDEVSPIEWIADNRARSEQFRRIVESGDRIGIIGMIKSIYATGVRRNEEGKKNYLADEAAMKKAEHVLYSEFSAVLGIAQEDVAAFISERRAKIKE